MQPRITVDTIANKEFAIKPRGYDQEEVDTFLDEICDELENQLSTIQSLQKQLREAQAAASRPVAPQQQQQQAPDRESAMDTGESSLREILQMAQKVKDETIAQARQKADEIVEQARQKAEEQLGTIATERESLTRQVETLRTTMQDYRTRFESLMAEQKKAMEKIADL